MGAQSTKDAARALLGPLATAVKQDALNRQNGITNIEVSFYCASLPRWLPALWRSKLIENAVERHGNIGFVKKVFSGPFEAAILQAFFKYQATQQASQILPVARVLGVCSGPLAFTAYLEDLPSSGRYKLTSNREAVLLAKSIAQLQAYLAWSEAFSGLSIPGHSILASSRRLQDLIRSAVDINFDAASFLERIHNLRGRLAALPQLLSHNDIGPGNMSVCRSLDKGQYIRFIDFGSVRRNALGADLHHYAAYALKSKRKKNFFCTLVFNYAEAVSQPTRDVLLGAYGYSIERMIMRWWRKAELRASQPRARAYLSNVVALLEEFETSTI